MANLNMPFGLKPVGHLNGSDWNGVLNTYFIPATDTNQYNIGDVVQSVAADDGNGIPQVVKTTAAGGATLGVFMGIAPVATASGTPNLDAIGIPASKSRGYYVLICDGADVVYQVQQLAAGTLTASNIGDNVNLKINAAPGNLNQMSSVTIDETTAATTSTLNCRLLRPANTMRAGSSNSYGFYAVWNVYINNHERAAGVTGV